MSRRGFSNSFAIITSIQICNTTWDKAGDMPSVVTAIIAAGRNRTINYNAGQACDVVIKVFMCIKTAWNRVRNMFATMLTTITTIWRPGFKQQHHNASIQLNISDCKVHPVSSYQFKTRQALFQNVIQKLLIICK